jgi:hypothetical protein
MSQTKPTPKGFKDVSVRLPKDLADNVDFLGKQCDLTGDQFLSAIVVLHSYHQGWIKLPAKPAPPVKKENI